MTSIFHVTVLLNLFLSTSFEPFPRRLHRTVADYFYWGNLTHNYCLAYLTSIYLEAGTLVFGLGISAVSGLDTMEFNDRPLTKSTSVSEFWGRRWNIVVGSLLRVRNTPNFDVVLV
jgi:hypothetical protein